MASPYTQDQAVFLESMRDFLVEDEEADAQASAVREERRTQFKVLIADSIQLHHQSEIASVASYAAGEKAGEKAGTAAIEASLQKSERGMAAAYADEIAGLKGKIKSLQGKLGGARATISGMREAAQAAVVPTPAEDPGKVAELEADIHGLRLTVDNLEAKIDSTGSALAFYSTEMPVLLAKVRSTDAALQYYAASEIRSVQLQIRRMRASRNRSMNNRRLGRHDVTLEKSVVEFGRAIAEMQSSGTLDRVRLVMAAHGSYVSLRQKTEQMKTTEEGANVLYSWRKRVRDVWDMSDEEMATIVA